MAYSCNRVEDNDCLGQTNMECFACGLPVCANCSLKRPWFKWGVKRICKGCHYEEEQDKELKQKPRPPADMCLNCGRSGPQVCKDKRCTACMSCRRCDHDMPRPVETTYAGKKQAAEHVRDQLIRLRQEVRILKSKIAVLEKKLEVGQ